jgi:sigma-E factor negative regulatory protein RseC
MESAAGLVVSVSDAIATIEVESPVACRRCASGRGCGAGLLASGQSRTIDVNIPPGMALQRGDAVRLVLDSRQLLRAAMLAYALPLAGLLLFAAIAVLVFPGAGDLAMATVGLTGLLAGFLVSRWRMGSASTCGRFVPVVDRRAK